MRHAFILATTLAVLLALAAPARAGMAEDCEQTGNPDLQIGGCTAVIRSGEYSGKNLAIAYNNRGVGYGNLGDYTQAIESYSQALRIDPNYATAYYNRGHAYDELADYIQAIADYGQALRIEPGLGKAYQNRGVSHENMGNYQSAAEDWERAIRAEGATRAKWWQKYMKGKGHYAGAIDGVLGPGTRRGLLACAIDPAC